jgi:hypothetical protein
MPDLFRLFCVAVPALRVIPGLHVVLALSGNFRLVLWLKIEFYWSFSLFEHF